MDAHYLAIPQQMICPCCCPIRPPIHRAVRVTATTRQNFKPCFVPPCTNPRWVAGYLFGWLASFFRKRERGEKVPVELIKAGKCGYSRFCALEPPYPPSARYSPPKFIAIGAKYPTILHDTLSSSLTVLCRPPIHNRKGAIAFKLNSKFKLNLFSLVDFGTRIDDGLSIIPPLAARL